MKKLIALSLIVTHFAAIQAPRTLWAEGEEAPDPDPIELNPEYAPSKKDEDFARYSATAEKWSFKEIPRDLGLSLKESFWGWGALGFAGGMGITAAFLPVDNPLNDAWEANALFGETGNEILRWTFSPYTYGGISLILWVVGHNTRHKKLGMTGRALTEAIFLSMAITTIGKFAFRRERPDGGNYSFPSGHSTAAFSTAAVLTTFYGWKGALPGYAAAILVSLNRLDSKAHWLTDVLGGAVIGTVVGVGTARFIKKDNPQYFIAPSVSHEQASLHFVYRF
ncbi:MAG: phosphatase PAP2 family protein [bacterium]|nr:phosphatase PAP2 family protein [bacterium]